MFGTGHGVSMGSKIGGGVNNLTVSNCSWNGTEYGIKIKWNQVYGGLVQNIKYCDLTMTNVNFPIAFYMDYSWLGCSSANILITGGRRIGLDRIDHQFDADLPGYYHQQSHGGWKQRYPGPR